MTLYDFIKLNQEQRAEHIYNFGLFLASSPERGNLYHLGDFYAEIIYNADMNCIEEVTCFKTQTRLTPYLHYIDLPTLIK